MRKAAVKQQLSILPTGGTGIAREPHSCSPVRRRLHEFAGFVFAVAMIGLAVNSALAADLQAGERIYLKCKACHDIGEGAKNKIGPILNGLEGRKSGTIEGYAYTDANRSSGILWDEATFKDYITNPKSQNSRHQDGVYWLAERAGPHRRLGLHRAIQS